MIISLFLAIIVVMMALVRKPLGRFRSVTWWYLCGLLLEGTLFALPIYDFQNPVKLYHVLILASTTIPLALGEKFGRMSFRPRMVKTLGQMRISHLLVMILLLLGILGQGFVIVDSISTSSISLSEKLQGSQIQAVRDELFDSLEEERISPFQSLQGLLYPLGLLGIVAHAIYRAAHSRNRRNIRRQEILFIAFIALCGIVALFIVSGRFGLVSVGVFTYIAFKTVRALSDPSEIESRTPLVPAFIKKLTYAAGAIVLGGWLVFYIVVRSAGQSANELLLYSARAKFNPLVQPLVDQFDLFGALLVNGAYLSAPLPTLGYFLDESKLPGPFGGAYSFPFLARRFGESIGMSGESWPTIRRQIFAPLSDAGLFANVWATGYRDFLTDFGMLGAPFFLLFVGFVCGYVRKSVETAPSVSNITFHSITIVLFLFFPFTSMFYSSLAQYSLFIVPLFGIGYAMWNRISRVNRLAG